MKYNPDIHNRRSIRMRGYDYSQCGMYFVTICTSDRLILFGNVENGVMLLNNAGEIAKYELLETPKHRTYVALHEHIVMPNHIHAIIEITDDCRGVACNARMNKNGNNDKGVADGGVADGGVADEGVADGGVADECVAYGMRALHATPLQGGNGLCDITTENTMSNISPKHGTLSTIIRAYKSAVSRKLGYSLWQRNYHEHIIRDEKSYWDIVEYIRQNPKMWKQDILYADEKI